MKARTHRLSTSTFLLAALAIPLTLAAQNDRGRGNDGGHHRHGDAHVTILQTTDLHDHANGVDHVGLDVDPVSGMGVTGSYARIAAYVDYVRDTTDHPVVLVDSGDWTMGTLYDFTLSTRPLALYFLERMHYNCITLGNHEFDYTAKGLAQILGAAQKSFGFDTPIVASNMNLGGDTDLAPFVGDDKAIQSTRVEELRNGIRIGYIGLMGKDATAAAPAAAPVSFSDFSAAQYAGIQGIVDQLRNVEDVDIVVALSHSGTDATGTSGEDVNLAMHVTGIDVIASGHTHTPLNSVHTVTNGVWSTQIIDAGAYGTNVARIDLTYHEATGTTSLDAFVNTAMTDASLTTLDPRIRSDRSMESVVELTDHQLNQELGPFFTQTFPDYSAANLGTGIYHPVGSAEQNMVSNGTDPVPAPDGLGDLAADAVRNVPNAIISQTLAAVGGNPANLPGYDFTPFQASVVATGVLRSKLLTGVALTFSDIYNVLPLGISPDSTQALPIGFPLVSTYLELADVKKLCALQLVLQTNLASVDYYLNFSGLQYGLKSTGELYAYFKYATAAGVLQTTSRKAAGGSALALQALGALSTLGTDNGAALLAGYASGNPYAAAMVRLNDGSPSNAQIFANLGAVGQVAAAAAADSAAGTTTLNAVIVSKAVAAIDTVAGFAAGDGTNTGIATNLSATSRVRVAVDLYAVLLLGGVQTQFGIAITPYASATGPLVLSGADIPTVLGNRIDASPATPGVQELKEWMALLSYLGKGLGGSITSEYASTANFTQFGSFGAAVQTRNASYPIANIGQFIATVSSLQAAP
jgi:2',3'-cyclic-nucleotide 2'-phosphodiesterase (5'-nucleotidase family)